MKRLTLLCAIFSTLMTAAQTTVSPSWVEKAREIHSRHMSLDTHTDTPMLWADDGVEFSSKSDACVTLDKMDEGALDAQYFAAYVASHKRDSRGRRVRLPLTQKTFDECYARVNQLIDVTIEQTSKNRDRIGQAMNSADIERLKSEGRHAFLIGVENGIGIGYDLDRIDSLAARGVTYITLTHVYDNQICTSSTHSQNPRQGLTDFGRQVVERMNRLGVLIDLSHCSANTFYDVIKLSTKPVVCTHSGAKSLCDSDRNLTDDQLRAIARNGGVVQVVAYKGFVSKKKSQATLSRFVDHIEHVIKIAGIDHVGIGTDFDGGGKLAGLSSDADFINITAELLSRGHSEDDIAKILGGNFLRVLDNR
jgi:microsomal dipeptidase-like Zn-dependent dipeptidase